ncbi:MAG: phenylalanine--tRNA ligase subunit alpha [Ruminococcaceae bacterium]|nr:phenylalanine--tRNA ligase subunit alpha [Oscillospiraceae bacterium]
MKNRLNEIIRNATAEIAKSADIETLEAARVRYLGKKGELTAVLKSMGSIAEDERRVIGKLANDVRSEIEGSISRRKRELSDIQLKAKLMSEKLDVTLPGTAQKVGKLHPSTKVLNEVVEIFLGMGFEVTEGPDIEFDDYCFGMLNMPKGHPARDIQDTFYINDKVLLRTQTSSVQVRTMLSRKPPFRIISPGRCYRVDTPDATHTPTFHQIEGLVIDRNITMSDLKGTLDQLAKRLYGDDIQTRFRPHHFPYTEPSAEMDAGCFMCRMKGCSFCKGEGYIELLGCGMVHPKVLSGCGIDPDEFTGYAFGVGLDRLTMLKYGINDIRLLFDNDMRFLSQF